jgi:REP element-mobilizing transposase RayT
MVPFYRRPLSHFREPDVPVFVTWRLADSLPPNRHFDSRPLKTVESFHLMDRLLDETPCGARYLVIPAVAELVAESIWQCATVMRRYDLHAFSVMPNHVHLLITPNCALPTILDSLKSFTARRASALLTCAGEAFWAAESYTYLARGRSEFEAVRRYVEGNPVRAMLVAEDEDYPWSSANESWALSGV